MQKDRTRARAQALVEDELAAGCEGFSMVTDLSWTDKMFRFHSTTVWRGASHPVYPASDAVEYSYVTLQGPLSPLGQVVLAVVLPNAVGP